MNKRKKIITLSVFVSLMFCLFDCSVIGSINLPSFPSVDDSENVITLYNNGNILFFNTKTEKVTQKWKLNSAIEKYDCGIHTNFKHEIINNEVYFSLDNKCYHAKKDTGENISLKSYFLSDFYVFIENKVLIRNDNSNYIYDPKSGSIENTDFDSYYDNFFKLNGEYYYNSDNYIYSYKNGKQVYCISEDDYYYNNVETFKDTNFYTFYKSNAFSDEGIDTIVTIKELREFILNDNDDIDSVLVGKLKNTRTVSNIIKNSDSQITLFEYDKNNYLFVSVYTKENNTWKSSEKITKTSNKIKIYYNTWIKEQNDAYWLKDEDDRITKINKSDFTVKEIKL